MPAATGIFYTGKTSVGPAAAEPISTDEYILAFGALVKADKDNTDIVYVGTRELAPGTVDITKAFPLEPGDAVFIEIDNTRKVFIATPSGTQYIHFVAT